MEGKVFTWGESRDANEAGNTGFSKGWGVRTVGYVLVSPRQLLKDPGYSIHLRYVPCVRTNHPIGDSLYLSWALTDLESSKKNWVWGQYWREAAAEKTSQVSAHLQFSTQCREGCELGQWALQFLHPLKGPCLCKECRGRRPLWLVAADLAVVPAGLRILQRSWSVFSSRGENLCESRIDGNKFDRLSVGKRSLSEASGETLKNG